MDTHARIIMTIVLGLAISTLSFWIALNILDRGVYSVLKSVFP
jgi:hypothetical protein